MVAAKNFKHGNAARGHLSKTYIAWSGAVARCTNPQEPAYIWYGARGIGICDRWRHSFENFLADMGEKPEGHSIERIDNDGDYSPENCRWVTALEQAQNKRTSRFLTHDGDTLTIAEWARRLGVPAYRLYERLYAGKPVHEVLNYPSTGE